MIVVTFQLATLNCTLLFVLDILSLLFMVLSGMSNIGKLDCYCCHSLSALLVFLIETSNQKRRAAALLGLPYYLKEEDPNKFIFVCEVCELIQIWHGKPL